MEVVTSVKLFRFSKWSIGLALWCVLVSAHACEPDLRQPLYHPALSWISPTAEDYETIRIGFEKMMACNQMDAIALENHYFFFVVSIVHQMGTFASEEERRRAEYEHLLYSAKGGYSESVTGLASFYQYGGPRSRYQIKQNLDLFDCLMATVDSPAVPYILSESNKASVAMCLNVKGVGDN